MSRLEAIVKAFQDKGFIIPVPNPWLKALRLRLARLDLNPAPDADGKHRIGLTFQFEW